MKPKYRSNEQMSWASIATRLSMGEATPLTPKCVCQLHNRALRKLRNRLLEDSVVREWLYAHGFERPQ
jgi:hypothetical protein